MILSLRLLHGESEIASCLREGLSCGVYFVVKSEELVSMVGLVIKIVEVGYSKMLWSPQRVCVKQIF